LQDVSTHASRHSAVQHANLKDLLLTGSDILSHTLTPSLPPSLLDSVPPCLPPPLPPSTPPSIKPPTHFSISHFPSLPPSPGSGYVCVCICACTRVRKRRCLGPWLTRFSAQSSFTEWWRRFWPRHQIQAIPATPLVSLSLMLLNLNCMCLTINPSTPQTSTRVLPLTTSFVPSSSLWPNLLCPNPNFIEFPSTQLSKCVSTRLSVYPLSVYPLSVYSLSVYSATKGSRLR
jgi:hypothetical protein